MRRGLSQATWQTRTTQQAQAAIDIRGDRRAAVVLRCKIRGERDHKAKHDKGDGAGSDKVGGSGGLKMRCGEPEGCKVPYMHRKGLDGFAPRRVQ